VGESTCCEGSSLRSIAVLTGKSDIVISTERVSWTGGVIVAKSW
jgi:hypothetical protein